MEGSRSATNNADMAYQEMVKNLEEARQLWEREMELLCKVGSKSEGTGREEAVGRCRGVLHLTLFTKL